MLYSPLPSELPLISKVFDFNPDDPTYKDWLIDIQSYKRIIGMFDKNSVSKSNDFEVIDTSDYGKW